MARELPPPIDCYVRLLCTALERVNLHHLESGLDFPDLLLSARARALEGAIALLPVQGYTEWTASATLGTVSVGWDWTLDSTGELRLNPHSVRTNVMLIADDGSDRGRSATREAIWRLIARHRWQPVVLEAVGLPTPGRAP